MRARIRALSFTSEVWHRGSQPLRHHRRSKFVGEFLPETGSEPQQAIRGRRLECCIPLSVERSPPLTSRTYIARPPRGRRSACSKAARNLVKVPLESAASEQGARPCDRRLADGPVGARPRSSSWDRGQLFRHWTDPAVR